MDRCKIFVLEMAKGCYLKAKAFTCKSRHDFFPESQGQNLVVTGLDVTSLLDRGVVLAGLGSLLRQEEGSVSKGQAAGADTVGFRHLVYDFSTMLLLKLSTFGGDQQVEICVKSQPRGPKGVPRS